MSARIYRPARNAMQSGKANSKSWILEFEPETAPGADPLMGWTSSGDMKQQLKLAFDNAAEAIAYAERNGLAYELAGETPARPPRKSYSDNFRWGRPDNWTH